MMDRLVLTDVAWERMATWIVRTGSPWRDLPEAFWGLERRVPVFQSSLKGAGGEFFFEAMSDDPDFEYLIVDSTIADRLRHVIAAKGALAVIPNNPLHKTSRLRKS